VLFHTVRQDAFEQVVILVHVSDALRKTANLTAASGLSEQRFGRLRLLYPEK